jgi:hypothetical protein
MCLEGRKFGLLNNKRASRTPVFDTKPYEPMGLLADVYHDVPPAFVAFLLRRQEV